MCPCRTAKTLEGLSTSVTPFTNVPNRPTTVPILEDHPRLRRGVLRRAGGLNPGKVTWWGWKNIAAAPSIKVVGGDGSFSIIDEGLEVRVVLRDRWMICPSCE